MKTAPLIVVSAFLFFLTGGIAGQAQEAKSPPATKLPGPPDAQADRQQYDEWVSLFDGKSLTGWKGDERLWSVVDGAITGRTTEEIKIDRNSFLIWDGTVKNFVLKLKFRIEKGNSGIQFRSRDLGEFSVGGYQADIDSNKRFTGILYEERGRGILCERGKKVEMDAEGKAAETGETCDSEAFAKSVDESQWCDYEIRAEGNHIIQTINGHVTVDFTDHQSDKAAAEGILALQIHQGPPMVVQFKDIQMKVLKD